MEEHPEVQGLPPSTLEDKQLTLAYQAGDDGAYQAIYDRYFARVHNVCRRMLPNAQDAQDATQESFLRVYQALGRFNGRYQLGAWITRIATNVCLDHLRAKSRRPTSAFSLDEIEPESGERIDIDNDTPDEVVIRRAESRRVRKVLSKLPPMHRAAIVLRDFEGLSYEEVAVALNISDGQVKALIHRARRGFKRSWTSLGASIFIPARWFPRLRRIEPNAKDQASHSMHSVHQIAEGVTAAAAPAASSCSVLSQCGSFVAERLAPALAAMAVGAASFVAPVAASDNEVEQTVAPQAGDLVLDLGVTNPLSGKHVAPQTTVRTREREADGSARSDEGVAESVTPAVTPSPTVLPTPSPTPSSTDGKTTSPGSGSGSDPSPKPTPSEPPAPPPFVASVGFDQGAGVPAKAPISNEAWFDCSGSSLRQTLVTTVAYGDRSYEATVTLDVSGSARLGLTLNRHGIRYHYKSWGSAPPVQWSKDGDAASVSVRGAYGPVHGQEPPPEMFPGAGSFDASLALDCGSGSLSAETVVFTEG